MKTRKDQVLIETGVEIGIETGIGGGTGQETGAEIEGDHGLETEIGRSQALLSEGSHLCIGMFLHPGLSTSLPCSTRACRRLGRFLPP